MTKNNKSGVASWLPQEAEAPTRQPRGPPGFGSNGEAPADRSAERQQGFKWFHKKGAAKAAAAEKANEKVPVEKPVEKATATAQANLTAMAMARAPLEQNPGQAQVQALDAEVAVDNGDIKPSKEVCAAAAQRDELLKQETDAGMVTYAGLTKDTSGGIDDVDNESTMANASDNDDDKRE